MAACDRFWSDLERASPEALRAHAEGCEACRALLEAFSEEAEVPAPPALAAKARAELAAHPVGRPWWWGALALAGIWLAILLALARPWSGAALAPAYGALGLPLAGVLLAAFGVAWGAALSPRRGAAALAAAAGVGVGVAALLVSGQMGGGWFQGSGCARLEVLSSALPLAVAVVLLRRFAFSWARAVAGLAAAGGVGLLLLELVCPSPDLGHVATTHVLPWVLTCAVAIVARRLLRSASFAP